MKRLLNLLTALTLGISACSTAVACGSKQVVPSPSPPAPKPPAKDNANQIAAKIKNKKIRLPANTDPNLDTEATIKALKNQLALLNRDLNTFDLNHISFNLVSASQPLQNNGSEIFSQVYANINLEGEGVDPALATVVLEVSINSQAAQIIQKVTFKQLTINYVANSDASNQDTANVIKKELKAKNYDITNLDLTFISFKGIIQNDGTERWVPLWMLVKVEGIVSRKLLAIKVLANASQIAAKINTNFTYYVASLTKNLSNYASRDDMRSTLQKFNARLYNPDIEKITFESKTLTPNTLTNVIATIIDSTGTKATITLKVIWVASPDEAAVNVIKSKITNKVLALDPKLPTSTANATTVTALKNSLKALNPTLSTQDIGALTFETVTLEINKKVNVTSNITINKTSVSVVLEVTLDSQSAAVADKITNTQLYLDPNTDPSLTNQATVTALKNKLQDANQTLQTADLAMIKSFKLQDPTKPLIADGTGDNTTVIAVIDNSVVRTGDITNVALQVAINATALQISNKITNTAIDVAYGTNPGPNDPTTNSLVIDNLALANKLTAYDKTQLSVKTSAGLVQDSAVQFTIAIKNAPSLDFNITVTLLSQAATIKKKITTTDVLLASTVNSSTGNNATQQAITTQLQTDNPTLTVQDLTTFSYNTVTLDTTGSQTPTNVTLTISIDAVTLTVTLKVAVKATPNQIVNKIVDPDLEIPATSDPSTDNPGTINAIKASLAQDNPQITDADLSIITFNTVNIPSEDTPVTVEATVDNGMTQEKINLQVSRVNLAQYIIDKIAASTRIDLPVGTNVNPTSAATAALIKQELATKWKLTASDLASISLSKIADPSYQTIDARGIYYYIGVNVTATVRGDSATTDVGVTMRPSATQLERDIKAYLNNAGYKGFQVSFSSISSANIVQVRQAMYDLMKAYKPTDYVKRKDFDYVKWSTYINGNIVNLQENNAIGFYATVQDTAGNWVRFNTYFTFTKV